MNIGLRGKETSSFAQLLPVFGLAALVFAAYLMVLRFPFVQDDWGWIARFQNNHPAEILKSLFTVKGTIFFRPLSGLYLYVMYLVFGAHPLPFHIVALLSLVASSWLVIAIMRIVTRDEVISVAAGFVYALSAAVHLECLLWAVGVNDLGASFFFLLSMLLFLRERIVWSVAAFCIGCLFKETVMVLPFILAGYALIMGQRLDMASSARAFRCFVAMAVAFCAFAGVKLISISPFGLASSHPYVIQVLGSHIERNLFLYASWMVQCLDPFLYSMGTMMKWVLNDLVLLLLFSVWLASRTGRGAVIASEPQNENREPRENEVRVLLFLLAWLFMALVPVIFLPNHTYRYYAIYALPAFIAAVLLLVRILGGSMRIGRAGGRALVICVAAGAALLSLLQSNQMLREGFGQRTLADGTNGLIRKAAIVEITRGSLMKDLPSPPRGAVILIGDGEIGAFNMDAGIRAWYGDQSISVYDLNDFVSDETGAYIVAPAESQADGVGGASVKKTHLDPAKVFAFRMDKTGLRVVNVENMMKRAASPSP